MTPTEFALSPSLIEAISWRLMAEIMRRHPKCGTLIETHPGGGQYDCLTILNNGTSIASLNRNGGFTVFERPESYIDAQDIWLQALQPDGMERVLNQMSRSLALEVLDPLPSTTPETLAFRTIASLLTHYVFDRSQWECRNGQHDTSGYGNQDKRGEWFKVLPATIRHRESMYQSHAPFANPNYCFWFVLRDEIPQAAISTDGSFHSKGNDVIDLMQTYRKRRKMEDVIAVILPHLTLAM